MTFLKVDVPPTEWHMTTNVVFGDLDINVLKVDVPPTEWHMTTNVVFGDLDINVQSQILFFIHFLV